MKNLLIEEFGARVTPYLPKRFQEGKLPYLFFIVWLMIGVMVVLSIITPYPGPVPAPLAVSYTHLTLPTTSRV